MTVRLLTDTTLQQRAHAAQHLIRYSHLDPELALSFVIWPRFTDIPRWVLRQRKKAA